MEFRQSALPDAKLNNSNMWAPNENQVSSFEPPLQNARVKP